MYCPIPVPLYVYVRLEIGLRESQAQLGLVDAGLEGFERFATIVQIDYLGLAHADADLFVQILALGHVAACMCDIYTIRRKRKRSAYDGSSIDRRVLPLIIFLLITIVFITIFLYDLLVP